MTLEMGYTTLDNFAGRLEQHHSVFYWMVLRQTDAEVWRAHALLVEASPTPSNGRPADPSSCSYGHVVALSGRLPGKEIAGWLRQGQGDVGPVQGGHRSNGYAFILPKPLSTEAQSVLFHKTPSHLIFPLVSAPWPYTQYEVSLAEHIVPIPDGPFSASDDTSGACPSFPNFHALVAERVYGVRHQASQLSQLTNQAIMVRIAQTEAWIEHVHIAPGELSLTVHGTDLPGTRVQVKGSPDLWHSDLLHTDIDRHDDGMQVVTRTFPLPQPVPSDLWLSLAHGHQIIDESYPVEQWHPLAPKPDNVTLDLPPAVLNALGVFPPSDVGLGDYQAIIGATYDVAASRAADQPESDDSGYEDILDAIQHMAMTMERNARSFAQMKEEQLRDHFLAHLNGRYGGAATNEISNGAGKTDILIRVEGKNIFIAEW